MWLTAMDGLYKSSCKEYASFPRKCCQIRLKRGAKKVQNMGEAMRDNTHCRRLGVCPPPWLPFLLAHLLNCLPDSHSLSLSVADSAAHRSVPSLLPSPSCLHPASNLENVTWHAQPPLSGRKETSATSQHRNQEQKNTTTERQLDAQTEPGRKMKKRKHPGGRNERNGFRRPNRPPIIFRKIEKKDESDGDVSGGTQQQSSRIGKIRKKIHDATSPIEEDEEELWCGNGVHERSGAG